jgi:hypothetical protein
MFLPSKVCIFSFLQIDVVAASVDSMSVKLTKQFPANAVLAHITTLEAIVKRKGREVSPMELEVSTGFVDAP